MLLVLPGLPIVCHEREGRSVPLRTHILGVDKIHHQDKAMLECHIGLTSTIWISFTNRPKRGAIGDFMHKLVEV